MNIYEAVLVFKPDLEEEKRNTLFENFKKAINENGEVTSVDEWGMRKLAYEINYIKEGYYYIVDFKAEPSHIKEFQRRLRLSDAVLRYMVIRKED
ncbi:MAG: 30S ribosomal protein S6 [Tissierellia bacterium]|nr:30S ribosomal protein S6 [Tissierellia bacterium]